MASSQTMASSQPILEPDILAYLLQKVSKVRVQLPDSIQLKNVPVINVYGNREPFEIFNQYPDGEEIYFITRLKRKNNGRFKRMCGSGRWIVTTSEYPVMDRRGEELGHAKTFRFKPYNRDIADEHGKQYFRREYTLSNRYDVCVKDDRKDYAISTLIKMFRHFLIGLWK